MNTSIIAMTRGTKTVEISVLPIANTSLSFPSLMTNVTVSDEGAMNGP